MGGGQDGACSGFDCAVGGSGRLKPLLRIWPGSITNGENSRGIGGIRSAA